jgi:hypothetical protein
MLKEPFTVETRLHVHAILDAKGQEVTFIDVAPSFHDGQPCGSVTTRGRTKEELAELARAIGALPELIASLKECIAVYETHRDNQPTGHLWPDPNHIHHARRALAKIHA